MEPERQAKKEMSRKRFLQICGSVIAGGSILAVSGVALRNRLAVPEGSSDEKTGRNTGNQQKDTFTSPYKLVSSFSVPDSIEALELMGDNLIVATATTVFMYDRKGSLLHQFAVGDTLRDLATDDENLYLLFPTRIAVYNRNGEWLRDWEACSDQSDYCSMTLSPGAIFVTDVANKNICKYTTDGNFVAFIQSPNDFIIPSYTFGITYTNGLLYCSNSGRHQIEKYTTDGKYVGSFGQAGGATGMFCGCCNPVHLTHTSTGEIITSEKGNPRISCYGEEGEFRSLLLDSKALGGGNTAYDIKIHNDKLFIAGKNRVSTFQYDQALAAKTACSDCGVDCPLREGITI